MIVPLPTSAQRPILFRRCQRERVPEKNVTVAAEIGLVDVAMVASEIAMIYPLSFSYMYLATIISRDVATSVNSSS